jgi:hypothetical protein
MEDEFVKYNQNYKTDFTCREVQQLLIYLETCLLGRKIILIFFSFVYLVIIFNIF